MSGARSCIDLPDRAIKVFHWAAADLRKFRTERALKSAEACLSRARNIFMELSLFFLLEMLVQSCSLEEGIPDPFCFTICLGVVMGTLAGNLLSASMAASDTLGREIREERAAEDRVNVLKPPEPRRDFDPLSSCIGSDARSVCIQSPEFSVAQNRIAEESSIKAQS